MAYYSPSEIKSLVEQWDIDGQRSEPMQGGTANANYMIYTRDHKYYTLTILRDYNRNSAQQLADLTNLLQGKVPTPRALPRPDGSLLGERLGRPVLLKPFWAGWVPDKSLGLSFEAGKLLGQLHQVEMPEAMKERRSRPPYNWRKMSASWDPQLTQWIEQAEQEVLPELDELPRVLIHGDIFPDNLLVDSGRPLAMLDPECFAYEPKELELGIAMIGLCSQAGRWNKQSIQALLQGYPGQVEKDALKAGVTWGAVRLAYYRYLKYQVSEPRAEKKKSWQEIKALADSFNETLLRA